MRRARGPTAKRTGDRRTGRGGLGGPGGRGGRRWAIRETERELGARSPRDVRTLSARDLAAAIKDTVEHDPSSRYSPYRRAMAMVAGYADRESKRMKPEKRKKLAETKRELREMFGHAPTTYGRGGPGKKRAKRPTKSRRTSRWDEEALVAIKPVWKIEVGDVAPEFDLLATGDTAGKGQPMKRIRLSSYRGKNVMLVFYPAAFTPVWTAQMPSYEEDLSEFERRNTQVLGISTDQVFSNEAWAKSMGGLSFPLLSDFWPFGYVCAQYGVLRGHSGQAERAIFVVDRHGKIAYVDIHDIGEQPPTDPIIAALDRLR